MAMGVRASTAIRPHAHEWHQIVYASAGVMTVWTERGSWVTPPHWAVWVPAGVAHSIRFAGVSEMRTLHVRPGIGRALPTTCTVLAVPDFLRALILRIVEGSPLDRRNRVHRALVTLLLDALRAQPTPAFDLPLPVSADLRRVADAFLADPTAITATATLAARDGFGLRTLERRFRAETGLSPGRWRRQARLAHALRALAAGTPIKQVADACGYRSPSAFVAAFRAVFGQTPGSYFAAP